MPLRQGGVSGHLERVQTTNPTWQRRNNLAVLARAVWQNPGLSRRDLDRRFQIDKSSISRLIQVLIDLGLVETAGRTDAPTPEGLSTGGRPRVALRIRAEYGQVWGLALWPDKARLTILNARGDLLAAREKRFPGYDGNWDRYLDQALAFAAEAAAPLNLPLLGIGFGVPGWVDFGSGTIVESFQFGLKNHDPLPGLSQRLPLLWENDANCGAWSCQMPGDDQSDSLYVLGRYIDNGPLGMESELAVGFGLVIAGRLHRGWRHRAGEYRSASWKPGYGTVFGVPDGVYGRSQESPEAFQAVAADLLANLRFATELLDPRTIYLGGDLKFRSADLGEALVRIGWDRPRVQLQPLPSATDEVSLGASQLVLDELFQLPSSHKHSLLRGYGTGKDDPLWRGLSPAEAACLGKESL
jgi:hypothetical protein